MTFIRITAASTGIDRLTRRLDALARFADAPMLGARRADRVVRDDVARQFAAGGDPRWKRARPFGSIRPAATTLGGRSGRVARAWQRGNLRATSRQVTFSPRGVVAHAHQKGAVIRARRRLADGRLLMQSTLAAIGAPWGPGGPPSASTLLAGLVLPRRPVRVTDRMRSGVVAEIVRSWIRA